MCYRKEENGLGVHYRWKTVSAPPSTKAQYKRARTLPKLVDRQHKIITIICLRKKSHLLSGSHLHLVRKKRVKKS